MAAGLCVLWEVPCSMQFIVTMPADDLKDTAPPVEEQCNFRQADYGGRTNTLYNSQNS